MNHEAQQRLEELLDREIAVARSLTDILAAERTALTGNASAAVEETAAEKIRLLRRMEALEEERRSLWNPGTAGLAASLSQRWRALLALIAGCRTANEVNGHIIHIRQNQIRQLFEIVRGGASTTYGRQGKTHGNPLRALARA
jgi:flagellar biosynthesis/type III secretory pathway chaperone